MKTLSLFFYIFFDKIFYEEIIKMEKLVIRDCENLIINNVENLFFNFSILVINSIIVF